MTNTGELAAPAVRDTTRERPVPKERRWRKIVIRAAATAILLGLLFWQVKWQDVWLTVRSMDASFVLLALLLAVPTQYFQFVKWRMLAEEAGPDVSPADIHRGFWVGFTLGLVTPGRIGQYGRALALRNCSLARAAGLTFIERGYSAIVVNALGFLALVFLPMLGWVSPLSLPGYTAEILLLAIAIALLVVGIFPRGLAPFITRVASRLPLGEKLARAVSAIEVVTPGRGMALLGLAGLGLASAVLQFVVLLWASGSTVPLLAGMLAGMLSFFLKGSLPVAIGNLGVGEWTAMLCLAGLGVPASVAVAASLVLFTMNVFVPGLIGLPFVSSLRMPKLSLATRATP